MKRRLKTAVMLLFVEKSLHRQTRTILIVKANHLDTHRLAFLQVVGDLIDTFVGDLADVQQTVLTGQQTDNGTKIKQLDNGAFVNLAHFDIGRDLFDALLSEFSTLRIVGSNRHRAVVFDVNLATGFFTQTADRGTALTDHVTDLFRIDLEGEQTRSPNGEFLGAVAGHFVHLAEDCMRPS